MRLPRATPWEVVRLRAPHVGQRYGLCGAQGAAAEGGAHAGRAVARRGAAHICARLAAALSRSQRSDAGTRPVSASTERRRQGSLWWPPVGAHCTHAATRLCVAHGCTWRAHAVRGGRAPPKEGGARVCRFLRRPREALELLTSTTTEILLLAGVGGRAARIHRAQKSRSGWAARFGWRRSCRAARSSATWPGTRTVWRTAQSEHKLEVFAQVTCGTMPPVLARMI